MGTLDQIRADIAATRKLNATELLLDVLYAPGAGSVQEIIERMEQFHALAAPS